MIAALILAAGGSARLGRPKQLVQLDGVSLLGRTVDSAIAGGCAPVVVVLGSRTEMMERALDGLPVRIVRNERWREGLSHSIRAGVAALMQLPDPIDAVLMLGCDQSRIRPEVVRKLRAAFDGAPGRMVASEYAGTVGVPAVFQRDRFEALLELRGDQGAKPVLLRHEEQVVRVSWPDGAFDIDRPEDLA